MNKDEALQMCLEYIETNAHERKYVRHAIKQALAAPVQDVDWKDMYEKEKRRSEMWVAKYEKDIGPLEYAVPVAARVQEKDLYDLAVKQTTKDNHDNTLRT